MHSYLDTASDKKIKAFFTLIKPELLQNQIEFYAEFKNELDNLQENYLKGTAKMINSGESKSRISEILYGL